MNLLLPGALIRKERLRRNWSQDGLCSGICAVSYLSKIEQGKVRANSEILHLLFDRLELPWYDAPEDLKIAEAIASQFYEALFAGEYDSLFALEQEFSAVEERMLNGPYAADAYLMRAFLREPKKALPQEIESYLDQRQLALQRLLQNRLDEAIRLCPCAYLYLAAGREACVFRGNCASALEYLQRGYDLAAAEGHARLMMECRIYMGNCYSNQLDFESMRTHYRIAERLARTIGADEVLKCIHYNSASTLLEVGRYQEAYQFFSALEEHGKMSLHKLAICCEKLGMRDAALAALDRAALMKMECEPENELAQKMCDVVRFRLEHPDYLHCAEYGTLLLSCFAETRESLPIGYASFHLPWVLEWYTAARQYKQAYELLMDFPIKLNLN